MINLVANALELTNSVIRMINRKRSRKTIFKISKLIEKIKEMESRPYETRIDSELDSYYSDLNILMCGLNKELEATQHEG